MKKIRKYLLIFISLILIFYLSLVIYTSNSYKPLQQMSDEISLIDISSIQINADFDEISYTVDNPLKQIIFIPGGKVYPESYTYLGLQLALAGYNVTIVKPFFNLAILTPNYAKRFLSKDLDNVIIGHSLGGVVASMFASGNDSISTVIILGSYPIKDLSDKKVLIITAENDINMDQTKFDNSKKYLNSKAVIIDIVGGNHAQFGWYGPQKGDGEASIDTLTQQNEVVDLILNFINE